MVSPLYLVSSPIYPELKIISTRELKVIYQGKLLLHRIGGMHMKLARAISWIGVGAMVLVLYYGFTEGSFFSDGGMILDNPWGIVSMVDLYVGFTIFSMWIYFREESKLVSISWIAAMMIFGFLTGSLYVALNIGRSKGDWNRFFMGWRSN
jgi:hypothetical protein